MCIAKVGGVAADAILARSRQWLAARSTTDPSEYGPEQWPPQVRLQADTFAEQLRTHGFAPPVLYFIEWSDLWSMFDIFDRSLSPINGADPLWVCGDRFEIRGYALPDGGHLLRHLAGANHQEVSEYQQLGLRLREAIAAYEGQVNQAVLVLLREVVGGLVTDDELDESLATVPDWLSRI